LPAARSLAHFASLQNVVCCTVTASVLALTGVFLIREITPWLNLYTYLFGTLVTEQEN
jgi:hypothetical protein